MLNKSCLCLIIIVSIICVIGLVIWLIFYCLKKNKKVDEYRTFGGKRDYSKIFGYIDYILDFCIKTKNGTPKNILYELYNANNDTTLSISKGTYDENQQNIIITNLVSISCILDYNKDSGLGFLTRYNILNKEVLDIIQEKYIIEKENVNLSNIFEIKYIDYIRINFKNKTKNAIILLYSYIFNIGYTNEEIFDFLMTFIYGDINSFINNETIKHFMKLIKDKIILAILTELNKPNMLIYMLYVIFNVFLKKGEKVIRESDITNSILIINFDKKVIKIEERIFSMIKRINYNMNKLTEIKNEYENDKVLNIYNCDYNDEVYRVV